MSGLIGRRPRRLRLSPMPPKLRWRPPWPRRLAMVQLPPLLPGLHLPLPHPPLALLLPCGRALLPPDRLPRRPLAPTLVPRLRRPPLRAPAWPDRRGWSRSSRRRHLSRVGPRPRRLARTRPPPLPLAVPPWAAMRAAEARSLPAVPSSSRRSPPGPVRGLSPASMGTPRTTTPSEGRPRRALLPLRGPPWWPAWWHPLTVRPPPIFPGLAGLATPAAASSTLSPWPRACKEPAGI